MAWMSAGTQRVVSDPTIPSKEYGSRPQPHDELLAKVVPEAPVFSVFPNVVDDGVDKVVFVYRPVHVAR
jgi:hypothetical protein